MREVGIIARLTMRKAVEQIAREMEGPRALVDIAQEAARRSGRPYTGYTTRTVSDALARLRFIVRCAPGTYAPARVVLDGKAFRVPLSEVEIQTAQLSKRRLEPFYSALEKPPLRTAGGEELSTVYLPEETIHMLKEAAVRATARALRETPWLERYLDRMDPEKMVAEAWERLSISQMDSGFVDLTPLRLADVTAGQDWDTEGSSSRADLIVRWDRREGALTVTIQRRDAGEPAAACEDRLLADFLASRLSSDHALSLGSLLLEAYARFPQVGRTPGAAAFDIIQNDPRMRVTGGDPTRLDEVTIARSGMLTWQERRMATEGAGYDDLATRWRRELRARIHAHPQRLAEAWKHERRRLGLSDTVLAGARGKVVPLRKPSNADLIAEWGHALAEQGVSDKVRLRKVRHLEAFVLYLEADYPRGPSHLLDVDETDLRSFFFWTYIRRYPNSRSDAVSFTLDLRDFYRHQQRLGRIGDARFAELIHGVRELIVERLELYHQLRLLADEPDFDDLYATLFIG